MPCLSSSSELPSKVSRITVPVAHPKPHGLYVDVWMEAQEQSMWPCSGRAVDTQLSPSLFLELSAAVARE